MWNNPTLIADQIQYGSQVVANILSNSNEKIKVIIRNDNSGLSDIFTSGLGLFDPRKKYCTI